MVDETPLKRELLDKGLVDEDMLNAATDRVSVYGGDLASQLLITDAVDERSLLDALAAVRDVAAANPDEYNRIDEDALAVIERPLLLEYSIIPFQKHRRNLGIFVVEPLDDTTVAELSETHGVRISQFIWPRVRYHQTLAALLDKPLPDWAQDFDDGVDLSFAEDLSIPQGGEALSGNSSPAIGRPVSVPHVQPDEIDFAELGVGWSRDQVLEFVESCFNRDAILHALLGYADWWMAHRMLIVLGKDSIQPYLIAGWDELPDEFQKVERLRQLRIPVDPSAAIFDQDQVGHFLADKPEDVGLGDLFVELTLFPPDRLLNQSIKIGNRPYMLLVGEPRTHLPDVPPGIGRLEAVATDVGAQLGSIIRAAKTGSLPPEGERIPSLPEPAGEFEDEVGSREELEAAEEASKSEEVFEPPTTPEIRVEEHAQSGRTLDGTGQSYAELKDHDEEVSAPQLAGSSEPSDARQTQHIRSQVSEAVDDDDISAPQLHSEQRDSRQTQAIPPGMAASSSVIEEESEEDQKLDDDASSTTFGIPFTDDSDAESEVSEPDDDASSTTFGLGFVDDEPDDAESEAKTAAESEVDEDEANADPEPSERNDPSLPNFDVQDSSSTMRGGFSVADSQSSIAEQAEKLEDSSGADDSNVDVFDDEDGPSFERLSEGKSFVEDDEEENEAKQLPAAKIVNFRSLATGRQSLQESSVEEIPADSDIPRIEPSSSTLSNGSSAFDDNELEDTADLLDSRNPTHAFNAAEKIVEWGGRAVNELSKRFPGRLFVDRYEYTHTTLPPAEEHGPIIAALAHLDDRAVSVVEDHLEDNSVELRFYATLLFKQLPVDSVTDKLIERIFDRDKMIRDVAADILINRTDDDFKEAQLKPRLREEVEIARDEVHVEVAARLLGRMKDRYAVPTLIEALEDASGKVKHTIRGALASITYQKLAPSVSEWRNWWASAHEKSRQDWIIDALNNDSEDVRRLVHHELKSWDDLDLDYHPDQPKKLRMRAQEQLRDWFEARD